MQLKSISELSIIFVRHIAKQPLQGEPGYGRGYTDEDVLSCINMCRDIIEREGW